MTSEFDLIEWIRQRADRLSPSLLKSIGDDCAVLAPGFAASWAVTTDMLVEDIHFRRRWVHPSFLGRKALAINLSDLAAMGACPYTCLLALALPRELTGSYFEAFMAGFLEEAERWKVILSGGDLSRSALLTISVTALGFVKQGRPVYRSSAREGDHLVLVGKLGLSRLGLEILFREDPPGLSEIATERALAEWAGSDFRYRCLKAHLLPEPLVDVGSWLQEKELANAMIDVSDGLASDLLQLARQSRLQAELWMERVPLPEQAPDREKLAEAVLDGGEDYALLFTASTEQLERVSQIYPAKFPPYSVIGKMAPGQPGIYLIREGGRELYQPKGFDHFR